LAANDCRVRNVVPGSRTDTYVNQYRLTATARGVVTIDLASNAFDAYLYVYSLRYEGIASNDNASADTRDARLALAVAPGTYIVMVSSRSVATGAYTLKTSSAPLRDCPAVDLALGETAQGEFNDQSCRWSELLPPSGDRAWAVRYRVELPSRGILKLKMASKDLSPFLEVLDAWYQGIVWADAEGEPEIAFGESLKPGTYYVVVSSSTPVAAGTYSLSAAFEDARPCAVRDLGLNETVNGELGGQGDCRYLDLPGDREPARCFRPGVCLHRLLPFRVDVG
jgi:hypothetical protein